MTRCHYIDNYRDEKDQYRYYDIQLIKSQAYLIYFKRNILCFTIGGFEHRIDELANKVFIGDKNVGTILSETIIAMKEIANKNRYIIDQHRHFDIDFIKSHATKIYLDAENILCFVIDDLEHKISQLENKVFVDDIYVGLILHQTMIELIQIIKNGEV